MKIGPYTLTNNLVLSPMAGITDRPFRQICRELGAGLAVSEMTASNPALRNHRRTLLKLDHSGEDEPRVVQIVGTNPEQLAEAAVFNQKNGAQIIDINMGCPAKKVCNVAAGSALLRDEPLVNNILKAVVSAVDIPVTLKIRTGWDPLNKNAPTIAKIAEQAGIQSLAIHGRTRACKYNGNAEFDTIKSVKKSIKIPVFANGDITTPQRALEVLDYTNADGLLIGRGAQGNPWIFREIAHYLKTGEKLAPPNLDEIRETISRHLAHLHQFYGDTMGVRIARKHIAWYFKQIDQSLLPLVKESFSIQEPQLQLDFMNKIFHTLSKKNNTQHEF
ncbi:MAG: tRNA dihydrouridine synthase DusB [Cycloclasticus sp.]|nr:tRNA dihydrouridine synthase DusB [Cycloclasticus sp.]MBG96732.1 tRNA dihydrouridine synthase DusB [Cycloclasticus sp.]HAI96625.1 tRNA dihydrouridine synthase DusB [Methylococcaceae bacterium]|tara:strand:+ start:1648 stop:2643 length:996 start_codon:yes stop_codon:yes gene_type:complete